MKIGGRKFFRLCTDSYCVRVRFLYLIFIGTIVGTNLFNRHNIYLKRKVYCPFNGKNVAMLIFARYTFLILLFPLPQIFLFEIARIINGRPQNCQWTTDKNWWSDVQDSTFRYFHVACNKRDVIINRNKNVSRPLTTLAFFCRIRKGKEKKVGPHLLHDSWAYINCVRATTQHALSGFLL